MNNSNNSLITVSVVATLLSLGVVADAAQDPIVVAPEAYRSLRVYEGLDEVHSVENRTATPSDFLRVEFKTEPLDEASLKGRYFREEPEPAVTVQRTQFEHAQVRITRIAVAPGESLRVTATDQPALLVALTSARMAECGRARRQIEIGQTAWLDRSARRGRCLGRPRRGSGTGAVPHGNDRPIGRAVSHGHHAHVIAGNEPG